jgi:hypothetical protein
MWNNYNKVTTFAKMIRHLYTDANYEYTLEVIFTYDVKKALKALYKKWKMDDEAIDAEGFTVRCKDDITKYALIFDYDKLTNNLISHEVLHVSTFILDDRTIDLAGGNDDYENLAWLNGHLNDLVRQIIKKEGIRLHPTLIQSKTKKLG